MALGQKDEIDTFSLLFSTLQRPNWIINVFKLCAKNSTFIFKSINSFSHVTMQTVEALARTKFNFLYSLILT